MTTGSQTRLLLWKNWTLRRRQKVPRSCANRATWPSAVSRSHSASVHRPVSWWRSCGRRCCSSAWFGCGPPTRCTGSMSVGRKVPDSGRRRSHRLTCSVVPAGRSFPQQGDALSGDSSLDPGGLLQRQQPLLQTRHQRGVGRSRFQLQRVCVSRISRLGVSESISEGQ